MGLICVILVRPCDVLEDYSIIIIIIIRWHQAVSHTSSTVSKLYEPRNTHQGCRNGWQDQDSGGVVSSDKSLSLN
jgi:hypothetical protein